MSAVISTTAPHAKLIWTAEMKAMLRANYPEARARDALRELATALGVAVEALYSQAHRMGLSREIRRR